MKDNAFVLKRYILKYLGIKCYSESGQFLNGSRKKKKSTCECEYVYVCACACVHACVCYTEREMSLLVKVR